MALVVPILTSFDGNGIKRAVADFKRLKTSGEKAGFVLSKAFLPAVGALAGLAVAAGKSVQAAIADEAAQAQLARTLRVSANATDATVISVEKYISSLGKQVAISDDEARPALATLVLATKDVAKAQELMAIAIDTAAATGKPLADVSEAMSKGFAGNTKGLKQLSPELFKLIKDGASAATAFAIMKKNFGGAGAEAAGTTAGQMKILQIQLNETTEAIGFALLPVLEAILPYIQKLGKFFEDNTPLIVGMGAGIGVLSGALVALKIAMVLASAASFGLAAGLTAVQIASGIGIIAVAAGVTAFAAYKFAMKGSKEEAEAAAKALDDLGVATDALKSKTKGAIENSERFFVANTLAKLATEAKAKADKLASEVMAAAAEKLEAYTSALQGYGSANNAAKDAVKALRDAQLAQGNAIDDLRVAQDKFNKVSKGYGAGSKEAKDATKNLAQAQRDATRASIAQRKAVQDVTDAQQKLDDLKSGKATNRATEDLASATAQVADAQKKLDAAYIQGGQDTIGDAVSRLNDAYDRQKEATDAVRDAQDASDPAAIAKAEDNLTTAKLDLVEQTLAQDDANQLVIDSQTLLNEAISGAASSTDVYKDAQIELLEKLQAVADANNAVTQSILDRKNAEREQRNAEQDLGIATKGTTAKQRKTATKRTGVTGLKAVAMASGGIVNKPTIAMIGEAGAEAVVPLDKMDNGNTFNITVNAGVGDPVAIGREVVSVLQAYQRRSGAIPIKVA